MSDNMNRKEQIEAAREERRIRTMSAVQEASFGKKLWQMAGAASTFVLVASLSIGFGVAIATGGLSGGSSNVAGGNNSGGTVNPGGTADPIPQGELAVKGAQSNPANAETDGFIFTNVGEIVTSPALGAGAQPKTPVDNPDKVDLKIYLDYACSYCKIFEDVESKNLALALATPEVNVSYHILGFLGSYSNAAGSASACVASLEPKRWDEVHLLLFQGQSQGAQFQTDEQAGGFVSGLLAPLNLSGETNACINELRHVDWIAATTQRAFTTAQATDGKFIDGTPTVVADGLMYIGEAFDAVGQLPGLIQQQLGKLK